MGKNCCDGGVAMNFLPLADMELQYLARESIDYDAGGQICGTVEG